MKRWFSFAVALVIVLIPTGLLGADPLPPQPTTKPVIQPKLPAGVLGMKDVKYGEAPGKANLLDLFLPENHKGTVPLIIWIHGGGWQAGDKAGCPALGMVARGYAVASLNYRFSQEAIFPACIQDCKGAIRYLRAHAKEMQIDPERVGVWGASAGGHLVALLGTSADVKELEGTVGGNLEYSSRVQAVCDWFGPTDMARFFPQAGDENIFKPAPKSSPLTALFGGAVEDKKELVAQANPITFITKNCPPFLIMHGDKDTLVPLAQSEILVEALNTAGVENHLEVLKGAGHGNGFGKPEVSMMIIAFFEKHLGVSTAPTIPATPTTPIK